MVKRLVVTLKVASSNLGKGKPFFLIIENKVVTESMMMVALSREQIKSLKSYKVIIQKRTSDAHVFLFWLMTILVILAL